MGLLNHFGRPLKVQAAMQAVSRLQMELGYNAGGNPGEGTRPLYACSDASLNPIQLIRTICYMAM